MESFSLQTVPFTELFKAAREGLGLTQTQLADKFGINQSTVSGWESGRRIPIDPKYFRLVEKHLGIERADIRPDLYR